MKVHRGVLIALMILPAVVMSGAYAEQLSESAVASESITLAASGEATVQVAAHKQIATATYAGTHLLGTWSARVTQGTVAWRLNPTIVRPYATPDYVNGFVTSTTDSSRQIEISLTTEGTCATHQLSGQWRYCPQGVTSVSGSIITVSGKNQLLAPGTYPVAIDAAVWSF